LGKSQYVFPVLEKIIMKAHMDIRIHSRAFFAMILVLILGLNANAQPTPWNLASDANSAPDLQMPTDITPIAEANFPKMLLLRPDGIGPFPAVMLGHQCGGLVFSKVNPQAANWSMLEWAKRFHEAGYVTLLIDFMGPRGAQQVCQGPQAGVTLGRTTKDFYQAADHLRKLPFVIPDKVAMVGYSQGALIALFNNSKSFREEFRQTRGFDAYVSFYPPCRIMSLGPNKFSVDVVQKDIEQPHLFLLGGADNETPASDCQELLAPIKSSGKPVQIHTYPDETHCWDCKSLNGFTKPGRLGMVVYKYSDQATLDSFERTKAFLKDSLKLQ
jgi:dienelactone hydrolase